MSWRHRAACIGHPLSWWITERGQNHLHKKAKEICQTCPVRLDCLDFAMGFPYKELPGVYGGLTENERQEMRSDRHTG